MSLMTNYVQHLRSLGLSDLWGLSRVPSFVLAPDLVLWNKASRDGFHGDRNG